MLTATDKTKPKRHTKQSTHEHMTNQHHEVVHPHNGILLNCQHGERLVPAAREMNLRDISDQS